MTPVCMYLKYSSVARYILTEYSQKETTEQGVIVFMHLVASSLNYNIVPLITSNYDYVYLFTFLLYDYGI